jgi:hypothetical protein
MVFAMSLNLRIIASGRGFLSSFFYMVRRRVLIPVTADEPAGMQADANKVFHREPP